VKFPRLRGSTNTVDEADDVEIVDEAPRPGVTPKKGRPTPKRREAEGRRRGPVAPPPKTQREAAKRARGTKEDRKSAAAVRRERMAAGDDRYLLPRDRGPVRAYARDVIDSRRHLAGLFMPLALLVLVAILTPVPAIQAYAAPATLVILILMVIEGMLVGRDVNKRVRVKFPDAPDKPMSLIWYSFVRSSQVRKLRMPKPRVNPGDTID
jgi:DUF3043 family protein